MEQSAKLIQTIKQNQKLVMNQAMKRAFYVLQMPLIELSQWLENELDQNPVLDVKHYSHPYDVTHIKQAETLQSYLAQEIIFHFEDPEERKVALFIAGSLNEKGFLTISEEELCQHLSIPSASFQKVLQIFQGIEPIGLGTQNVKECLLLQLITKGKAKTRIYQILDQYFSELIHNQLDQISKAMKLSIHTVRELIKKELKHLDPFPGHRFNQTLSQTVIADLIIEKEEGIWKVEVEDRFLPTFDLHPYYLSSLKNKNLSNDETEFIRRHFAAGKWLMRSLDKRKKTLKEIGELLLKKQMAFFEGDEQTPLPLTRRDVAKALNLNESTIARAILNKYISCPQGVLPLSQFFSHSLQTDLGLISNQKAKHLLISLIEKENKINPLSDEALSKEMQSHGIPCARRTVSKYRKELKIGTKQARKMWN